jgi:hypothetical protein
MEVITREEFGDKFYKFPKLGMEFRVDPNIKDRIFLTAATYTDAKYRESDFKRAMNHVLSFKEEEQKEKWLEFYQYGLNLLLENAKSPVLQPIHITMTRKQCEDRINKGIPFPKGDSLTIII